MSDPYVQSRARIVRLLFERGWFPMYASGDEALALLDKPTLLAALQDFNTLTGAQPTEAGLDQQFCALPDRAPVRRAPCKWPHLDVTWHTEGALGPIGAADFKAAAAEAFGYWSAVCGLRPVYSANPSTANIVMHAHRFDGSGGVLADSQLPCGVTSTAQLEQRYDSERWVISENPRNNEIDVVRVIAHELGHAFGSDHLSSGNLLAPTYSTRIRRPQAGDISAMVSRYGLPKAEPPPIPPVVPPVPPTPDTPTGTSHWQVNFASGNLSLLKDGKPCRITVLP